MAPVGWRRSTFMGGASVVPLELGVAAPLVIGSSAAGCVVAPAEGIAGVAAAVSVRGGSELSLEHAPTANTRPNVSTHAFMSSACVFTTL